MIFSINQNKNWTGKGFFLKPGLLEISQSSFLEQEVYLQGGRYMSKIIGSSQSGNGIFQIEISSKDNLILIDKNFIFKNKNNSEILFSFDVKIPNNYKIRIKRKNAALGRILINLFNIDLISNSLIIKENKNIEKKYFILDYDNLKNNNDILKFFNCTTDQRYEFLIKSSECCSIKPNEKVVRIFFNFEDILDFITISEFLSITLIEDNIGKDIIEKYKFSSYNLMKVENNIFYKNKISGTLI